MPLYEYDCPKCGRFEVLQKMSDPPVETHDCGNKVHKLMSASAFSFKGSGFYITDYGKDGKKSQTPPPAANKGGPTSSESKSTSESKPGSEPKAAETKPAAKPESKPSGKSKSGE